VDAPEPARDRRPRVGDVRYGPPTNLRARFDVDDHERVPAAVVAGEVREAVANEAVVHRELRCVKRHLHGAGGVGDVDHQDARNRTATGVCGPGDHQRRRVGHVEFEIEEHPERAAVAVRKRVADVGQDPGAVGYRHVDCRVPGRGREIRDLAVGADDGLLRAFDVDRSVGLVRAGMGGDPAGRRTARDSEDRSRDTPGPAEEATPSHHAGDRSPVPPVIALAKAPFTTASSPRVVSRISGTFDITIPAIRSRIGFRMRSGLLSATAPPT